MKACENCKLKYPNDSSACFVCGRPLVAIRDPLIGTTIAGRYLIEEVIGEGGMATVYSAHHRLVDRPCAIKVMSRTYANDEVVRERFRREAKAAQKLAHPNIIEIFDQGELDGSLYLVMELLTGHSVAELLQRGRIPIERAIPIGIQLARGLARAHDLEVIHRDLKPENVFVTEDSNGESLVKILDFGIARSQRDARLTGAGEVFGTPQYMAPERITSIDAGPSADLYALGVMLYEMLSGNLPFDAPDVPTFFLKHLKEKPKPLKSWLPDIPEGLDRLVLDLLEKQPEKRPVDAHRVHADLVALAKHLGIAYPREVTDESDPSRAPAATLPPAAIDQWVQRTHVFERMLETAHPEGDARLAGLLAEVKALVHEVAELRGRALTQQRALEAILARGRELRQSFGHAVDALGVDASHARDELKAALAASERAAALSLAPKDGLKRALSEILLWEGRSALAVPYHELADAYRAAAARVDEWCAAHDRLKASEARVAERRVEVEDLEFQIKELRAALAAHEEQLEREASQQQRSIGELGSRADALEQRLLELATEFCAPLRRVPLLRPLFRELETGIAA